MSKPKDPFVNRLSRGIGKASIVLYGLSFGLLAKPYVNIPDYFHGFVLEFNRFVRVLPPGTHSCNPVTEKVVIRRDVIIGTFECGVLTRRGQFVQKLPPGIYFPIREDEEEICVYDQVVVPEFHKGVRLIDQICVEILSPGRYDVNPFLKDVVKVIAEMTVKQDQRGVFVRNGVFEKVLPPGLYFANTFVGEELFIYDEQYVEEHQLGVLVKEGLFVKELPPGKYFINEFLNEQLFCYDQVLVKEGYRGVKCRDGKFVQVLAPGKYNVNEFLKERIDSIPEVVIEEEHKGLKLVEGKYVELLPPGRHFANPVLLETIKIVDLRVVTKELVPQQIYTKDTTCITIHSILVYQITDPMKAILEVENIDHSIREQIKSISQQVMSEQTLDYIMENKAKLSRSIRDRVKEISDSWGILVIAIDIKELQLDDSIKKEMTASAKARREAESKLINATADVEIAEKQRQVAELLNNPYSSEIRQHETLKALAQNGARFIFVAQHTSDILGPRLEKILEQSFQQGQHAS